MALPLFVVLTLLTSSSNGGTQNATPALILRNVRWETVQVEARLGPATDCAANPSVGTRTLRRGQRWAFVDRPGAIVCWRRERVPGEAAQGWTDWTHAAMPDIARREVEL